MTLLVVQTVHKMAGIRDYQAFMNLLLLFKNLVKLQILNGTLKCFWPHCGIVLYAPMYIRCFFQVKLRVEMRSSPLYTYDPAIPNHCKF